MDSPPVLPAPLASACADGHPVELWVLVEGEIVKCPGMFMQPGSHGRPQMTASLPAGFVGVIRNGSAVRGFFADNDGAIHTFLTSVHRWLPYQDNPRSARIMLEAPVIVAPCQRRRSRRRGSEAFKVALSVTIRGHRESVQGRMVDASANGVAVRLVRTAGNWFGEGTRVNVEIELPDCSDPVILPGIITRVQTEALHYRYGIRAQDAREGRRIMRDVLDQLI